MPASKIKFFYDGVNPGLKERTRLKQFIEKGIRKEGGKLQSLNYIFCTDERLLEINKEYLGHHDLTDIISFNLSNHPGTIEGEIYISVDRVRENARLFKVPVYTEMLRVLFHGALHLCGYRDKSPNEQKKMRAAEDRWLKLF